MEFRNSGLEESYQLGIPVFYFFSSHHFSIIYYLNGSRPSTNSVGMAFHNLPLKVEFPHAPDPLKAHPEQY